MPSFTWIYAIFFLLPVQAQELNCRIKVSIQPQLANTVRKTLIQGMERSIGILINQNRWTKEGEYRAHEKLQCEIVLTIQATPERNSYEASLQLLLTRPVYATNYQTVLFSHIDNDCKFKYVQEQPLRYIVGGSLDDLTALMAFYAYVLLGVDADSFTLLGGKSHFEAAQRILALKSGFGANGWSQFGKLRNRYWLITNLLDPQLSEFRALSYQYHRHGMDILSTDAKKARAHLLGQFKALETLQKRGNSAMLSILWMDAKYREAVFLFSKGSRSERKEAFDVLKRLDPPRTAKYERILKDI